MSEQTEITVDVATKPPVRSGVRALGEITFNPRYETDVPRNITDAILSGERLPKEMPKLGSSIIEDFIIDKVKTGVVNPQEIAEQFIKEGMPAKIDQFVGNLKIHSNTLDWEKIFTLNDARKIQLKIIEEMRVMEIAPDQIAKIEGAQVDIAEGVGISSCSDEAAYTSRLQAVRKALDYVAVFGNDIPPEDVIKALMSSVIGHELGHKIDRFTGIATNNIKGDISWVKNGNNSENKSERFAEYWGGVAVKDSQIFERIRQREWLIHLAKVTQVWDTLAVYNSTHGEKVDLAGIFRAIDGEAKGNGNTVSLLFARRVFYSGNEVESYASPYPRDVVANVVKQARV